ncbi:MAG: MBL fold metallo-hydrolase [Proteobacteria bacterium]|nr:MBL fold metallo-hydrolase [Pseudomonadota bacterium]
MKRRTLLKTLGIPTILGVGGVFAYSRRANARSFYYEGPPSDHFDGVRFFLPGQTRDKTQAELWSWRMAGGKQVWPASFASPFQDRPPGGLRNGLRVTLIGHASFLIQAAGQNILVDPVYSERASPFAFAGPKRVNAPGIAFSNLPRIDHILITHNHYDHMDMATLRRLAAEHPGAKILVPLGNDAILAAAGITLSIAARDWGEAQPLSTDITAHLVPAKHWSARGLFDRRHALWCGFVLETPAGIVHICGDTGYHQPLFTSIREKFGAPRLSLIPIGAYEPRWFMRDQHVDPQDAVNILLDCGAKAAIGCHWGTFQLTDEAAESPAEELAGELVKRGIGADRFVAFRPGQVWEG